MGERAKHGTFLFVMAISAGCGGREVNPPPLAAVLRNPQDWPIAVLRDRGVRGNLLSAERVSLGVVELAGGSEQVACTEYEKQFVVHIGSGWRARGVRVLPELHCRVVDAGNRPLRFLGIDPSSFTAFGGGPTGIRWASPLAFVFLRTGRKLEGARVIVTTEEAEKTFAYGSTTDAPGPGVERPSDD